jgi:hypothetical protein
MEYQLHMKYFKILAVSTILSGFAGTALAQTSIDNQTAVVTVESGDLSFSASADKNQDQFYEVTGTFGRFAVGGWDFASKAKLSYATFQTGADRASVGLETNGVYIINDGLNLNAGLSVDYSEEIHTGTKNELFTATPKIGLDYAVSRRIGLFSEVGYTVDLQDGLNGLGGYAEVGASFAPVESTLIKASLVKTFNTGADDLGAKVETVFRF